MSIPEDIRTSWTRRRFLGTALAMASAGPALLMLPGAPAAAEETRQSELRTYNGGTDPYPIPWLDKNGSHNQPAGPELEPSHIFHFKGRVARCAGFTGMGTDNRGVRVPFGTKTTDYGLMQGEYFAGRAPQTGTFTHI